MSRIRPTVRRALAAGIVASCAGGTLTALAPAAPAASVPGEVVLDPFFPADLPKLSYLGGSDAGLAWQLNWHRPGSGQLRYLPSGAAEPTIADIVDPRYVSVVGRQVTFPADDPNSDEDDAGVSSGPLTALDLQTGEVTEVGSAEVGAYFRGGTGDGYLEDSGGIVRTDGATGDARNYGYPEGAAASWSVFTPAADERGAVIWFRTGDTETGILAYLDFARGTWTTLETDAAGYDAMRAVDIAGDAVVWARGDRVAWLDRPDLTTVHTQKAGAPIVRLAAAGANVAVTTREPTSSGGTERGVRIGTLGGTWRSVTSQTHDLGDKVVPVGGGKLGVVAGSTIADYGVYRLDPAKSTLGPAVVLFGPNPASPISADVGRLNLGPVREDGDPVVRTVTSDAAVTRLTVGPATVQADKAVPSLCKREFDSWVLCTTWGNEDGQHLVVRHDDRFIGEWKVQDGSRYQLTAHGVLVSHSCGAPASVCGDDPYGGPFDDGDFGEFGATISQLIDLDSGKNRWIPYTTALSGDDIFYALDSGEIRRRNLRTGAESVLREPGVPTSSYDFDLSDVTIEVSGDWLRWYFRREPANGGAIRPHVESVALNLKTGQRYDITDYDDGTYKPATLFAAGSLAWIDDEKNVHFMNLTTGKSRVVGKSDPAGVVDPASMPDASGQIGRTFALTSEFLAWMDGEYRIHLIPLGEAEAGTPRFGGAVDEPAFTPAGGGDYDPQGDTNRPLSAWTMTIKSTGTAPGMVGATAAGRTVRALRGSARTGEVRPLWDGKDADGHKVPDGLYTWTLTGAGAGGALTVANGGTKAITGSVRVDSGTPRPVLGLASVAPRSAPSTGFAVTWSSRERGVRFTIRVKEGTPDRNGVLRWSKAVYWQKRTTATSARYGAKGVWTPFPPKAGRSYRFSVTAVDRLGNTASVVKTIRVPKAS